MARWNVTKRKAYEGARDRLQEIIDSYPEFSRMDEVLFLMGELHFKLAKNDKAVAARLTYRPVAETLRDTLAWWPTVPEARRAKPRFAITPEQEEKALAAWHAR